MTFLFMVIGFIFFGGPIGAFLGYILAKSIQKSSSDSSASYKKFGYTASTSKYFYLNVLAELTSSVMTCDGVVDKREVAYAKEFFLNSFSKDDAVMMMQHLKESNSKKYYDISVLCSYLNEGLTNEALCDVIKFFIGLANCDGEISYEEKELIKRIARFFNVKVSDYYFSGRYKSSTNYEAAYTNESALYESFQILGLSENASNDEVKKAYKSLAQKCHPDKVAHLGQAEQEEANKKFTKINIAFEAIKASRGFK